MLLSWFCFIHEHLDPDRAGRLYELAAAKGRSSAAFNLACLHREGRITHPVKKRALNPSQPINRDRNAEDDVGDASLVPEATRSYDAEVEARRWLAQARQLGLGKWGLRRRLLGRWFRRWTVWIAVVVRYCSLQMGIQADFSSLHFCSQFVYLSSSPIIQPINVLLCSFVPSFLLRHHSCYLVEGRWGWRWSTLLSPSPLASG